MLVDNSLQNAMGKSPLVKKGYGHVPNSKKYKFKLRTSQSLFLCWLKRLQSVINKNKK